MRILGPVFAFTPYVNTLGSILSLKTQAQIRSVPPVLGFFLFSNELPPTLKISILIGEYFIGRHAGQYYAQAQNLNRRLREAYDDDLSNVDLLVMPTCLSRQTRFLQPMRLWQLLLLSAGV
jgi:hypothetical protein